MKVKTNAKSECQARRNVRCKTRNVCNFWDATFFLFDSPEAAKKKTVSFRLNSVCKEQGGASLLMKLINQPEFRIEIDSIMLIND